MAGRCCRRSRAASSSGELRSRHGWRLGARPWPSRLKTVRSNWRMTNGILCPEVCSSVCQEGGWGLWRAVVEGKKLTVNYMKWHQQLHWQGGGYALQKWQYSSEL